MAKESGQIGLASGLFSQVISFKDPNWDEDRKILEDPHKIKCFLKLAELAKELGFEYILKALVHPIIVLKCAMQF